MTATGTDASVEGADVTPIRLEAPRRRAPAARVALVRPPCVVLVESLTGGGPMPPIGLAYVAAAIRDEGHAVQVIDAAGEALRQYDEITTPVGTIRHIGLSPEQVAERIEPDTHVVGITLTFLHEWPIVRTLATVIRARHPDVLVVVGGETATAFWAEMFEQCDAIDVAVLGEGERTAAELVSRVAQGVPLDDLDGIALRSRGEAGGRSNGLPVRMRKLGEVARPAWDLFPLDRYFAERSFFGVDRGRAMPMLATRGCPYKCSFCSAPKMWTTRYIVRDPDDIVDEIAEYVETYGVRNVDFVDLTAMTKRRWTLEFCDALERRGLDITWQIPIGTRAEGIDGEVLQRLWDTGCRNITFAPESGSPRMLDVFDKRCNLDHILADVAAASRLGMAVHVNTIIGHPDERWSDRLLNLRFLLKAAWAGAATGSAAVFHPYPGSRDYDVLVAEGKVRLDEAFYYDGLAKTSPRTTSWNDGMSSLQLYLTQLVMVGACFGVASVIRPRRIVHLVRSVVGRVEEHTFAEQQIRARLRGGPLSRSRAIPTAADEVERASA